MRVILRLSVIYFLIGVLMLNVNAVASDEETPLIPLTILLDEVLLDESASDRDNTQEITAAWLAYALARVAWIREHITIEYLEAHAYRR
ncbi:hypothetical protein KA005_80640, partial [bacterium]|nr:hypothetical protein [bacterium]